MRFLQILGGGTGLALQLCAGAAAVIWPKQEWIAWIFLILGIAIFLGSLAWWFFANYRFAWPVKKRPLEATVAAPDRSQKNHSEFDENFATGFKRAIFQENKGDRRAVVLRLTELRDDGVMLRNSPGFYTLPAEMDNW